MERLTSEVYHFIESELPTVSDVHYWVVNNFLSFFYQTDMIS